MSRPICWICSKQLMYVGGKPVFTVLVDPIGAEHKVHKACAKEDQAERDQQQAADFKQRVGASA